MTQLFIQGKQGAYAPAVVADVSYQTDRRNYPGTLKFSVVKDKNIKIEEGDLVNLIDNGQKVFYGFVFKKAYSNDDVIQITAYDQIRYLKNKDTKIFLNMTADEIIKQLAGEFGLQTGTIENTGHKISSQTEKDTTLIDMIQTSLDRTLINRKEMYVFYDDFGKLTLKNIKNMVVPILIDEATAQTFDYTSSIDDKTYNQIKLIFENEEEGKREIYIAKDSSHINEWGVLQYLGAVQENENGQTKADNLLKLYNQKTRHLNINGVFGDNRVKAGTSVFVKMDLGDLVVNNKMLVEKCVHKYKNMEHFMDLTLRGGDIIAG